MATTTNYIWDDDAVLMETDETGATTATYTREPDQFGSLISSIVAARPTSITTTPLAPRPS